MYSATFVFGGSKVTLSLSGLTSTHWLHASLDAFLGCGLEILLLDAEKKEFDRWDIKPRYKVVGTPRR